MIELEDFKKLKQNDRIEFLLRRNHLKGNQDSMYFNWVPVLFSLFAIIGFIVLLSMQFYITGDVETFISILSLIEPLSTVIFLVVVFGVMYNLLIEIPFKKLRKELEEEFFKIETKPKK